MPGLINAEESVFSRIPLNTQEKGYQGRYILQYYQVTLRSLLLVMVFEEKISVVMPTYNTDVSILKTAVDSILNQTFRDFEFIIIDDGSTNNSVEYLNSIADQRVKLIRNDTNIGITKSLNIGLRAAKGKYIARMDSDDIAFPERFEKQYAFMESHPDVFVCGTKVKHFRDELSPAARQANEEKNAMAFIKDKISWLIDNTRIKKTQANYELEDMESYRVRMLFANPGPMHPTAFLNHEKLIKHHMEYDERLAYAQDYDLWMRISSIGRICVLPDVLLHYRIHSGQVSKARRDLQNKYAQMIQKKLLEQLLGTVTEDEVSFHHSHSSSYGYDSNTKISNRAIQWYEKIITANQKQKIYDQNKLEQYIDRVKRNLISHSITKDMSTIEKVSLFFQYLPITSALRALLIIANIKTSRFFALNS